VALLRKETCNWARSKRRGFITGAAVRHRGQTRVSKPFVLRSDVSHQFFFEIGHSSNILVGDVRSQKSRENRVYKPQKMRKKIVFRDLQKLRENCPISKNREKLSDFKKIWENATKIETEAKRNSCIIASSGCRSASILSIFANLCTATNSEDSQDAWSLQVSFRK